MNKSTFFGKYRALVFAVGMAVVLLLAGCGKKAPPVPPSSALAGKLVACQADESSLFTRPSSLMNL